MTNPYKQLKTDASDWEVVGDSALSCQQAGCYLVNSEGLYSASKKLLKWTCANGHNNTVVIEL